MNASSLVSLNVWQGRWANDKSRLTKQPNPGAEVDRPSHMDRLHNRVTPCQVLKEPGASSMGTESITEDELEAFHQRLQGPLGEALRKTGVILERRMRDRGTSWDDLTDDQVADAFVSAFMEAAPEAYPDVDRWTINKALAVMADTLAMELAANAPGGRAVN
ncbi:hypothetical protein [Brevundimonas sp. TWP1-2-1b1]|uniref:hypothetical protein n=1 Tax=unclassified Brevundimonas TaxID=2622653 RepID=UPI003CE7F350